MDKLSQIRSHLIGSQPVAKQYVYTGTVVSVDGRHCKVKLSSGLEVTRVKLTATIGDEADELLIVPTVGSAVTMVSLSGTENNLTIVKFDRAEYITYRQAGMELLIDSRDGKVSVKNEQSSLKEVFDNLTALLRAFKVTTPIGPSGTALEDVVLQIDSFEQSFNGILK